MQFIDIDGTTAVQQINWSNPWNLAAISGGRAYLQAVLTEDACADALVLPVGNGYRVRILLAADDTYTVQRVFARSGKVTVKGEQTNVYCDELGEVAYQASCFRSNDFGAHKVSA